MTQKCSFPPVFGFEVGNGINGNANASRKKAGNNYIRARRIVGNVLKFAGYVPLLGAVVGIGRIADMVFIHKTGEYRMPLHLMAARFARATLEIAGLAAVLLPLDAACTVFRFVFIKRFDIVAAIQSDDSDFVKWVLKDRKLDLNIARPGGRLPLHIAVDRAAASGSLDVLTALLEDPRVNPNIADELGWTALRLACRGRDPRPNLVRAILANRETDPNARGFRGETRLHEAVYAGNDVIVQILLENERFLLNIKNDQGYSPLDCAVLYENARLIKPFLEKGQRVRPVMIQTSITDLCNYMKLSAYTPFLEGSGERRRLDFLQEFFDLCLLESTENVMEEGDLGGFREALEKLSVEMSNLMANAPDEDRRNNATMRLDSINALCKILQPRPVKSARKD